MQLPRSTYQLSTALLWPPEAVFTVLCTAMTELTLSMTVFEARGQADGAAA